MRFNEDDSGKGESQTETTITDDESKPKTENLTDYVTHMSLKRHSSLFHNALRRKSNKVLNQRAFLGKKAKALDKLTLIGLEGFSIETFLH